MSGWLKRLASVSLLLMLVVSTCLGGYSSLLSHRLNLVRQQMAEQRKTLAQQSELITTLRTDDARSRVMIAEQQRREQQLRQQGETYQRKLRDALKSDKCGNSPMPASVIGLLQQKPAAGTTTGRAVTP